MSNLNMYIDGIVYNGNNYVASQADADNLADGLYAAFASVSLDGKTFTCTDVRVYQDVNSDSKNVVACFRGCTYYSANAYWGTLSAQFISDARTAALSVSLLTDICRIKVITDLDNN